MNASSKSNPVLLAASVILMSSSVIFFGWRLAAPRVSSAKHDASAASVGSPPPLPVVSDDPAAVFQRAFWKRPTPADEIRHAERREWRDADGITRWQWFIEVKPSPELVKHLIADNAFSLVPAGSPPLVAKPPAWFAVDTKASRILRAPGGGMTLLFDEKSNLLLATDSGGGFRKGAPEPTKPVARNTAVASRLPNHPPPKP